MIILSLVLMLAAQIVSVVGHLRNDCRTIVGAVLSIVAGKIMTCRTQVTSKSFLYYLFIGCSMNCKLQKPLQMEGCGLKWNTQSKCYEPPIIPGAPPPDFINSTWVHILTE